MVQTLVRIIGRATAGITARNLIPKRLTSTSTITKPPSIPSLILGRRSLTHAVRPFPATRFTPIRCCGSNSSLNSGSNFSESRPINTLPVLDHFRICMLYEMMDYEATKQEKVDFYIKTAAKVLGSEEEAKKKITNVYRMSFGVNVDLETALKLRGLPEVDWVYRESCYLDGSQDYGGELVVNGEIVQRSPENQRRLEAALKRIGHSPDVQKMT